MKKNVSVQIIRIIAMIMIIVCHIVQEFNSSILVMSAQFFNVGVFIFLLLSGYLYGQKDKIEMKSYIKGRITKILLPVWIFIIYISIVMITKNQFDLKSTIMYVLSLQYFTNTSILGLNHLWFISIIMVCYIFNIFLIKYKTFFKKNKCISIVLFLVTAIIFSFINPMIGQTLFYLLTFYIGFIGINISKKSISFLLIIMSIVIRLLSKKIFDDTTLYDVVMVSITQIILAHSVFSLISKYTKNFKSHIIINILDNITFYIYIVHYQFMTGPFNIYDFFDNQLLCISALLILSTITAIILEKLTKLMNSIIDKLQLSLKNKKGE